MADAGTGPITLPPHLDHEELALVQQETLNTPRRPYGMPARVLFALLDVLYRRKRTLSKFKVLELVARVPYQSWEQVAYIAITHVALRPGLARRIHDRVAQARVQQDNEQWHLLILEELVASTGKKESRLLYYWIPQAIAFAYYQVSWLLYVHLRMTEMTLTSSQSAAHRCPPPAIAGREACHCSICTDWRTVSLMRRARRPLSVAR